MSPPPATDTSRPALVSLATARASAMVPPSERLDFEGAEWTVPQQRLGAFDHAAITGHRLGSNVQDHLIGGGFPHRHGARRRPAAMRSRNHDIVRQQDLAAVLLGRPDDLERGLGKVGLGQRLADLAPLRQRRRCWPCRRRRSACRPWRARFFSTGILLETLAPPMTAAVGRLGFSNTLLSALISSSNSGPA